MIFEVASGLFIVNQVVYGRCCAADRTRVAVFHGNGAEQHLHFYLDFWVQSYDVLGISSKFL